MIILTIFLSFLTAEILGYFLHRLLHSNKISWLSYSHMYHHLKDYGPKNKMRTEQYFSGAKDRINILGLGLEWLIPGALFTGLLLLFFSFLKISWLHQIVFICGSIGWSALMFNYFHSAMHLKKFWLIRVPILGRWFIKSRKLHDIHHIKLSDDGRMNSNYGICFFFMDRIFGTLERSSSSFNFQGYKKALKKYERLINEN